MAGLFEQAGARPQKQPKYAPIFIERAFTGIYTQRSPLHDPGDLITARFYGGRPDALWMGSNVELTNRLTLQRRPGLSPFSTTTYPTPPNRAFSFGLLNGTIQVIVDTADGVYYDQQNGSKTLLFTKGAGAGQTYFVAVAGVLYMGDGVETKKYTPGNPNGTIWNWGIAAPTAPPSVAIVSSGSSAVLWQANTYFSTMGLIVDSNGNVQQLYTVNADGSNPSSRYGVSSNGQPAWDQTPGGTTSDNTVTWTNQGAIGTWLPTHLFLSGAAIYEPTTKCVFIMTHNFSITTASSPPNWNPALVSTGARTIEISGGGKWGSLGQINVTPTLLRSWAAGEVYGTYREPSSGNDPNVLNCATIEPTLILPAPAGQTIYLQGATTGGTTNTGSTPPTWGTTPGLTTQDGQLGWICLSSATWAATTNYSGWMFGSTAFSVIKDSNNNFQVCTQTGASGGTAPTWGTSYGASVLDGSVIWTCVGAFTSWHANATWYLPVAGFVPPSTSQPYGGASVIDTNSPPDIEFVISSGKSGSSPPSWGAIGADTTDSGITWYNVGIAPTQSLSWTKGHVYAYSYKARTTDDTYVTAIPPGANPAVPLGAPTGSETGAVSTASPVYTITGANTGAVNTVSGESSTDPQVDTIIIWRDADGGGADNMLELTEIPNPPPIGGQAVIWSFEDYLPDVPTNTFPGLNNLIPAPIDDSNDPPPSSFLPMVYNFQRIWGANGNSVPFSGGPDVLTGNPNEAFNPADEFPFLANVTRLVKTSQGLITLLTDSIEIIAGGPSTASFYSVTLAPGIGLLSYNALDVYAGEIYFFSADSEFKVINPSLNLSNAGFPLGDQFSTWDASKVYVAVQQAGIDNCIMVADGSTGWYRVNPHQIPGGANGPEPIWSPFATITGGSKMVQSVEVSPGIKKLLVGSTSNTQEILERDLSVFTDNGTQYDAWFVMGSIVLCRPGQIAALKFLEMDFSGISYQPTVSYLLNEISGNFNPFTASPVFDPPSLYGTSANPPSSYSPNRYYFSSTASVARARHMQIKVDFGMTSNGDEVFDLTIFGRLFQEG